MIDNLQSQKVLNQFFHSLQGKIHGQQTTKNLKHNEAVSREREITQWFESCFDDWKQLQWQQVVQEALQTCQPVKRGDAQDVSCDGSVIKELSRNRFGTSDQQEPNAG